MVLNKRNTLDDHGSALLSLGSECRVMSTKNQQEHGHKEGTGTAHRASRHGCSGDRSVLMGRLLHNARHHSQDFGNNRMICPYAVAGRFCVAKSTSSNVGRTSDIKALRPNSTAMTGTWPEMWARSPALSERKYLLSDS